MVEGGSGGRVHLGGERRGFAARGGASGRAPSAGQRESSEFGWWTSGEVWSTGTDTDGGFRHTSVFFFPSRLGRSAAQPAIVGGNGWEVGDGRMDRRKLPRVGAGCNGRQQRVRVSVRGGVRGSRSAVGGRWSSLGTRRRRKRARYSVEVMRMDPRCDVSGSPTTSGGDCGWKGGGRELPELPSFQWG